MNKRAQVILVSVAVVALLIGVTVYLIDRSPGSVYFVPDWLSMSDSFNRIFGVIGNYLPTFVHPYAFILLTTVLVKPTGQNILISCVAWFTVDSLFECAQKKSVAQWLVSFTPTFDGVPVLENTRNYFLRGTFDVFDLISITLGTIAAYLTVKLCYSKCH